MFRSSLLTLPLLAAALAVPAGADAATTLGQMAPAGAWGDPCEDCVYIAPAAAAAVPSDGVLTSWNTRMGSFLPAGNSARLVVLRAVAKNGAFTTIATSSTAALNSQFKGAKTRIAVKAGDRIGIKLDVPGGNTAGSWAAAGHSLGTTVGTPDIGQQITKGLAAWQWYETPGRRANVQASLEADADADGFGDETQDACPQVATADGACPPPPAPPASAPAVPAQPAPPAAPAAPATPAPSVPVAPRAIDPGTSSVRDVAAPKLAVDGATVRGRRVRLRLSVASDEAATLVITARTAAGRSLLRAPRRLTLSPGRPAAVRLALRDAVRRGARIRVTLTAVDPSGNRHVVTRVLRAR